MLSRLFSVTTFSRFRLTVNYLLLKVAVMLTSDVKAWCIAAEGLLNGRS